MRIVTYSVTKAWSDEEFKAKLMADPKSVLKENGVDVAEALGVGGSVRGIRRPECGVP